MMTDDWYRDSSASDKSRKTLKSHRKRPSTGISSIMDTKVEPLFTLPEHLMTCKRPKPREETSVILKQRLKDFYENSYSGNRLRRERFRRFMVGLIVKPEGLDAARDKDVNRYYNYVRNGVDTIHVSNMGEDDVEKILSLVPSNFRERFQDFMEELMDQVRENYVGAIKQSIVDFVLSDPFQEKICEKETVKLSPEDFISTSDFNSHCNQLQKYLFPINPCMRLTLEHWIRDWKSFRLIDFDAIEASNESWNLIDFKSTIFNHISNGRKTLKSKWFANIQNIFLVNNRKGLVPSPLKKKSFRRFFDCASTMMEAQLRSICTHTLQDFMNIILHHSENRFKLNVIVKGNELVFDPPIEYFGKVLCQILETVIDAIGGIERLETQLYLDWSGPPAYLKPKVSATTVENYKKIIRELLENQKIEPEEKMDKLREHSRLYNGEELSKVNNFLSDTTKTLEDYQTAIAYYHNLAAEIPIMIEKTVFAGLFEITQNDFIETIVDSVQGLKTSLINQVVDNYQAKAKLAGNDYQAIAEKALSHPMNTAGLMELIDYVQKSESVSLKSLESTLLEIIENVAFLSDFWLLSDDEITTNNKAFNWFHQMPKILEEYRGNVKTKTLYFQEALKSRYQKFEEELETYAKQVEEVQHWGDMDEVFR